MVCRQTIANNERNREAGGRFLKKKNDMILIESRENRTPGVEVYTYNMIKRFDFTGCTVKEDSEAGVFVVTTYDNDYFIAMFPVKETAYILKTKETDNNITFVQH